MILDRVGVDVWLGPGDAAAAAPMVPLPDALLEISVAAGVDGQRPWATGAFGDKPG